MKNFDLFVGVDWSGAKAPINTKSIAVAEVPSNNSAPRLLPDLRSRSAVAEYLVGLAQGQKRVLIGMDCNFGYSQKVGVRQFGQSYDHMDLWHAVEAANQNTPNYFAGGYWTHPDHKEYFWTNGKKPKGFEMPQRLTEKVCGDMGYGYPESPFKMIGVKQVGKGGLAGMRLAYDLKQRLGDAIAFWPFEESAKTARIVVTEIYPRQFLMRTGHGSTKIRSADDLNSTLKTLESQSYKAEGEVSDHDTDALVSAAGLRFLCGSDTHVPDEIARPPMLDRQTAQREGWIFGVGDK